MTYITAMGGMVHAIVIILSTVEIEGMLYNLYFNTQHFILYVWNEYFLQ